MSRNDAARAAQVPLARTGRSTQPLLADDPWWLMLIKAVLMLRHPAAAHAVRDLVRAQGRRPDAAPSRPELERAVRSAAVAGRRAEAALQGRHHPGQGGQGRLHPGPGVRGHPGVPDLLDHPGRRRGHDVRRADRAAADRPAGRRAGGAGAGLDRRLRDRARRLGVRLDLPAARRAALGRADDLLRRRDGAVVRRGVPLRRARCPPRRSSPSRSPAGTSGCCRCRSSSTASRWSARPTGRRSTWPRPRASWSAGSTPSTRRCGSGCSSWPSTST